MTKRGVGIALLLGAWLAAPQILAPRPAYGQSTEQAIKEIQGRLQGLHTLKADMAMEMQTQGMKQAFQGTVLFQEPMSFRMTMGPMVVVLNGRTKTMWTYVPDQKMAMKMDMDRLMKLTGKSWDELQGQQMSNPKDPFSGLRKETVRFLRKETLNGEPTYVFQGILDPSRKRAAMQQQMPFDDATFWLSSKDGLLRKLHAKGKGASQEMTMTFSNVQINPPLNEGEFSFTPPAGTQITDMTLMMEQMFQKGGMPSGK